MNYTTLFDSCQANLPVQYASRSDTGIVIDSEPLYSLTCKKASSFLHWLSMITLAVSLFRFTFKKTVNTIKYYLLNFKCFYILDIDNKM